MAGVGSLAVVDGLVLQGHVGADDLPQSALRGHPQAPVGGPGGVADAVIGQPVPAVVVVAAVRTACHQALVRQQEVFPGGSCNDPGQGRFRQRAVADRQRRGSDGARFQAEQAPIGCDQDVAVWSDGQAACQEGGRAPIDRYPGRPVEARQGSGVVGHQVEFVADLGGRAGAALRRDGQGRACQRIAGIRGRDRDAQEAVAHDQGAAGRIGQHPGRRGPAGQGNRGQGVAVHPVHAARGEDPRPVRADPDGLHGQRFVLHGREGGERGVGRGRQASVQAGACARPHRAVRGDRHRSDDAGRKPVRRPVEPGHLLAVGAIRVHPDRRVGRHVGRCVGKGIARILRVAPGLVRKDVAGPFGPPGVRNRAASRRARNGEQQGTHAERAGRNSRDHRCLRLAPGPRSMAREKWGQTPISVKMGTDTNFRASLPAA